MTVEETEMGQSGDENGCTACDVMNCAQEGFFRSQKVLVSE
jgi:hypothetical protein